MSLYDRYHIHMHLYAWKNLYFKLMDPLSNVSLYYTNVVSAWRNLRNCTSLTLEQDATLQLIGSGSSGYFEKLFSDDY